MADSEREPRRIRILGGIAWVATMILWTPFYFIAKALGDPYIKELDEKERQRKADEERMREIRSRGQ